MSTGSSAISLLIPIAFSFLLVHGTFCRSFSAKKHPPNRLQIRKSILAIPDSRSFFRRRVEKGHAHTKKNFHNGSLWFQLHRRPKLCMQGDGQSEKWQSSFGKNSLFQRGHNCFTHLRDNLTTLCTVELFSDARAAFHEESCEY